MATTKNPLTEVTRSAQVQAFSYTEKASLLNLILGPTIDRLDDDIMEQLSTSYYNYYVMKHSREVGMQIELRLDDTLPFKQRMLPVVAIFHAFKVKNRKREVSEYNGSITYKGDVTLDNGWTLSITISVNSSGLPPTCHLEPQVITETVTRIVYKSVCDDVPTPDEISVERELTAAAVND